MYIIVTNAVTLVRNEFRPFVAYAIERAHALVSACVRVHALGSA